MFRNDYTRRSQPVVSISNQHSSCEDISLNSNNTNCNFSYSSFSNSNNVDGNVSSVNVNRKLSATETLLLISPKLNAVNNGSSANNAVKINSNVISSQSLPQSIQFNENFNFNFNNSLPPSPPLTPATPIAFPSPRIIPPKRQSNSRNSSPGSLNDDPLDLYDTLNDVLDERLEETLTPNNNHNSPVIFNMDSFSKSNNKKECLKGNEVEVDSMDRGRKPSIKHEIESRGRSRHRQRSNITR